MSNDLPEVEQQETTSATADPIAGGVSPNETNGNAEASIAQQLSAAQEENAQLQDRVLRMAAEFENYKKRMERERLSSLKYAGEYIFRELLSVVDNLERAIAAGQTEGASAEQNLSALSEGLQLTYKNLKNGLEKFEVKAIDSVGKAFDPTTQEALTMEASETIAVNHIVKEFEKGYYYKDRLLRPAKVIVSAGKNKAAQDTGA